jgi:energy-coupling factor transporter ATP-binding protein EcfA2
MAGIHVNIEAREGTWSREILTALLVFEGDTRKAYNYLAPNVGMPPLVFKRQNPIKGEPKISVPVYEQKVIMEGQIRRLARQNRALIDENTRRNGGVPTPPPTPPAPTPPAPRPKGVREWLDSLPSHPEHERQGDVLARIAAGIPVYLHGPAGSGKSELVKNAAKALDKPYHESNLASATSSAIDGSVTPDGVIDTAWVRSFKVGGILNAEEIDAAHPTIFTAFNNAIASDAWHTKYFGILPKPADWQIVATGNTLMTGATKEFVGRMKLDAATIDRFRLGRIEVKRDGKLENHIVKGILADADDATLERAREYHVKLGKLRTFCQGRDHDTLESMRSMIDGMKAIKAGVTVDACLESILAPWSDDTRRQAVSASK